jgi:uncharacterized protein YndB with AHSA1/START domain
VPVGLTKDAGWEVGVSRTVPVPLDDVWAFLTSRKGVKLWLGAGVTFPMDVGDAYKTTSGATGELRGYQERRRVRLTHRPKTAAPETTIQVALTGTAGGTTIHFHQERMTGPEERARQRAYWRAVMGRVVDAL